MESPVILHPPKPRSRVAALLFPELPSAAPSHGTIPSLDGIRAISIVLVVAAHCGLSHIIPGGLGVTIFFFLSGYLITTLMRREAAKTGTINLKTFYIRRSLRILPSCYLVVALVVLLALALHMDFSWSGVLANIGYYTNYYPYSQTAQSLPGLGILWSLAVEEHFYLVFPLIFLAIYKRPRRVQGAVLTALCLAVLAWRCALVFGYGAETTRTYYATDTRLDSILWGCLMALVANPVYDERPTRWLASWPAAALGLITMLLCLVVRPDWFRETFRYTLQALALIPLFAIAIKKNQSAPFTLLNSYGMRLLGLYTYSIYLTHFVLAYFLREYLKTTFLVEFPLVLLGSWVLAAGLYRYVEQPLARVRRRYSM